MRYNLIIISLLLCIHKSFSQQQIDSTSLAQNLPNKYFSKVDTKINSVDDKITKQTVKYLHKLEKQENKIKNKLSKVDSSAATTLANSKQKFNELSQKIKSKTAFIGKITGGQYSSYIDSLGTSLNFLKQFNSISDKAKEPLQDLQQLQNKLQETENIQAFIAKQKAQIQQLLSKYANIPGLKKEYDNLSKTAYYYSAQIKEYKETLKDPEKVEQKALSLLNKLPAFQKFMQQNSQLASLFRIPGSGGTANTTAALAGLQTRASVQSLMQQEISIGGPNAQAQVQQNLSQAHAEIDKLKDQINKLGGGSSDVAIPDFKPNNQKTKSFLKRLEFGSNVQSQKASYFFPVTTDIGLSVGYKLNDKGTVGIGASYKVGWGKGWDNIHITSQGVGLRSFIDYKIKGSIFLSGGYEQNYLSAFYSIDQLKNYSAWQSSGLIGLSKKYKINKKVNGEMKLLYDLLANTHAPVSQPIVFRLGYTLK